ncbi:hypothetical protein METBIDRAFT_29273 [Metschnikowia bicuspidata var. bicuspidata NRRL YB-4993]|uniref:Autophagy-related protein 2 n=1 Tax=Metschnikowia bicuspidata var. bicuspidata NRRL YB-4993 TaxID=869754 RepID=A0A1A0HFK5_9ASCO|nr:hypothetical protein METBIDRAFT_29273 [Metschnikowia bicuspidata var. bicuspidata NRRL YB-4993]OBA22677.1 hypothetical protein METBIDRAFT_29273 [Metschnikowia bicuspidata var. bicuspidata NRRL YB-4993]
MYLNWIPQNIQKRVFLYILQQLSLFSGIELPNLEEVSFNNIHLRDVAIDPEKITQIPGLRLRHGLLHNVSLKGSVKEGANLEIAGVDLVVAPSIDNLVQDIENAQALLAQSSADLTHTILLDSSVSSDTSDPDFGDFSGVSGPGLSSSIPHGSGKNLPLVPGNLPSSELPSSPMSADSSKRPSSLGGVMSKAIDMALLKLQIRVTNVTVKIVIEPADLILRIEEVVFSYKTGIKILSIKGLTVAVGRPFLDAGIRGRSNDGSSSGPHQENLDRNFSKNQENRENGEDSSESDQSDDQDDDEVVEEPLMDSMIFTPEEASSIYMSATSQSFAKTPEKIPPHSKDSSNTACLLHVDCIDVLFENVSPLSNVRIDIQNIKVAAVPLFPAASVVVNSLSKLFKLSLHQLKKRNSLNKPNGKRMPSHLQSYGNSAANEANSEASTSSGALDKLHVKSLEVSLTSALNTQGSFASFENEVSLIFSNFKMKIKDESLTYGGLEAFEILRYFKGQKSHIFEFNSADNAAPHNNSEFQQEQKISEEKIATRKADVRFEYLKINPNNSLDTELTILISKPGSMYLDAQVLKYFLNLSLCISALDKHLNILLKSARQFNEILNPGLPVTHSSHGSSNAYTQVVVQTASFEADVRLSATSILKFFVLPISYNKAMDQLIIPGINMYELSGDLKTQILKFSEIRGNLATTKFDSFHYSAGSSAPRKAALRSSTSIHVGAISGTMTRDLLSALMSNIGYFLLALEIADNVNSLKVTLACELSSEKSNLSQSSNLLNSIYSPQNRYRRMNNAQIMFGDVQSLPSTIKLTLNLLRFSLTDINKTFGGLNLKAERFELLRLNNRFCGHVTSLLVMRTLVAESLLNHISNVQSQFPMIQFRQKGDEKLIFEVVCRGFMLNYHVNWLTLLNSDTDKKSCPASEQKMKSTESEMEIRMIYHDFAIGVLPGRLKSKLCLTAMTGSLDIALNYNRFCFKSSFRDLKVLLIDDIHFLRDITTVSGSKVQSELIRSGYVDIGFINLLHVGIDVDKNCTRLKLGQLEETNRLSGVDPKINIDHFCLDTCADSAHTFLQTMNDLKEPMLFKDQEKFRLHVKDDFLMPDDIFEKLKASEKEDTPKLHRIPSRMTKDEIIFVDNYRSEQHSDEEVKNPRKPDLNTSSCSSDQGSSIRVVESYFNDEEHTEKRSENPFTLSLNVRCAEVYLHDGYDWKSTRKSIKSAVKSLEKRSHELDIPKLEENSLHGRDSSDCDNEDLVHSNLKDLEGDEHHLIADLQNFMLRQTIFESIHIGTDKSIGASNLVEIINAQVRGDGEPEELEPQAHTNVKIDKTFKDLKLRRSQRHKISAEIHNLSVKAKFYDDELCDDHFLLPTSQSKVANNTEIRLDTIEILDNVQSSTWNRMLTYLNALGKREIGNNMLELSITNVRPDSRMPFTEMIIALKVLPLRLFIDQDTLGFATRFFGFKDSRFGLPAEETPYFQKITIDPLRIKFDYKPKSINYAGIRSGNNAELANLFILDGSDLKLKKAAVYGVHGFPKLGRGLAQIYGPYIQKYQLSGLLSGLAPIKSIINVGNGVRDLVSLPIEEYKRDGRVLHGIQKGSISLAKVTANELLRLGVKLASGAQVVLENLEEYFGGEGALARRSKGRSLQQKPKPPTKPKTDKRKNLLESSQILKDSVVRDPDLLLKPIQYLHSAIDEEDLDSEIGQLQSSILLFDSEGEDENEIEEDLTEETERKVTSLYSNQPSNAKEGFKSAFKAMGHNFKGSKKKFSVLKRELKSADTLQEQIVSVARNSPVIVIRPLIGGTEAMMKTLMGISNGIDSRSFQESHDKYRTEKNGE